MKKIYADYHQLLADPEVDAVYIATPPFLHKPMTIDALRAGKHVLLREALHVEPSRGARGDRRAETVPHLKVICCLVALPRLGHRPESAGDGRQPRAGRTLSRFLHAGHRRLETRHRPPAWRNDPTKNGGGMTYDWGPYDFDWLSFVLGDLFRPRVVFGTMGNYFPLTPERVPPCLDVDGHYCAQIICESGLTILWERRAAEHGPDRHTIELRGTQAGLDSYFMPMPAKPGLQHYAYVGTDELKTTVLPDAAAHLGRRHRALPFASSPPPSAKTAQPSNTLEDNLRIHGVIDALLQVRSYAGSREGHGLIVGPFDRRFPPVVHSERS